MIRKLIIATSMFVIGAGAHADECDDTMTAIYNDLLPVAQKLAALEGKELPARRLERANLKPPVIASVWPNGLIQFSGSLCDRPYAYQQGTISHEFGHLLQYAFFPKAKEKLAPQFILTQSQADHEWAANHFGAKLFRAAGIDSGSYLEILDTECAAGSQYQCSAAESWRIGLTW